jgi:hypothetical protein
MAHQFETADLQDHQRLVENVRQAKIYQFCRDDTASRVVQCVTGKFDEVDKSDLLHFPVIVEKPRFDLLVGLKNQLPLVWLVFWV